MERTYPVPPSDSSAPIPSDSVRSHNDKVSVRNAPIPSDSVRSHNDQVSVRKTVITRHPPLLRVAHQELLSPHLSQRNAGEGEGDRLAEQPIEIQRPVQLPQ